MTEETPRWRTTYDRSGEQGWYFNQGEKAGTADDWFTVAALVNAGY